VDAVLALTRHQTKRSEIGNNQVPRSIGFQGSETLSQTLAAVFHTIDASVAAIFTLVLAVIRATVGALTNTVTALFPKLAAIFDSVANILASVFAAFDAVIDAQVSQRRTGGDQSTHYHRHHHAQ
jgi:uncharacterized Tic20 family protein